MKRKHRCLYLIPLAWQLIQKVPVFLLFIGLAHSVPKPVPDTKGCSFLFSTPLYSTESPPIMYIIPQTTAAVNITMVSLDNLMYHIPAGGVLRQELPFKPFTWNEISFEAFYVTATTEVTLYIEYRGDNHIVFPYDTLGTEHVTTTQMSDTITDTFIIITGNNSLVEIDLPLSLTSTIYLNGLQFSAGSKFNFSLGTFETVGIKCACDLSSVTVSSSLPVSVTVGAINNNNIVDAVMEHLPPVHVWGRKFMFTSHRWIKRNVTLKITGRDMTPTFIITLKDSTLSASFVNTPSFSMQLAVDDFLAIESNSSVLCSVIYSLRDMSGVYHHSYKILTPILLFHISSTFAFVGAQSEVSATLVLTAHSYNYIMCNATTDANPFTRPMTYFWNFFICKAISISDPYSILTSDSNTVPFYGSVIVRGNNSAHDYSLGMRITRIYDACVKTSRAHGGNGDGIDNDCDNKIDEERLNSKDDDADKLVDEDIVYSGVIKSKLSPSDLAWEYYRTHKEVETGISTSVLSVVFSILAAFTAVGCFIGGMILADRIRQKMGSTRIMPIVDQ